MFKTRFFIFLSIFIVANNPNQIFSQQDHFSLDIVESKKEVNSDAFKQYFDDIIEQYANHFIESYGIDRLYGYVAVAESQSDLCEILYDEEKCFDDMNQLLEMRNLAMGRCSQFKDERVNLFCKVLKERKCSLNPDKAYQNFCEGYLYLDFGLIRESLEELLNRGMMADKDEYERYIEANKKALAYYSALKTNSISICLELLEDKPYFNRVGCRILVSSFPQDIIKRYALDFSYYYYSCSQNNKNSCKKIESPYIRKFCGKGIEYFRFVSEYFLK